MMAAKIESQRHMFDLPDAVTYLNCAYMSPLMHGVVEAGEKGVRMKARPWRITPTDFFTTSEKSRTAFGAIVGAQANDIAIIPSVSYGIATAALNLPVSAGQDIICLEDQFPSNIYAWQKLCAEKNANFRLILKSDARAANGQVDWTGALLEAIGEKTAIVALPHCHWTDGALIDLVSVARKIRQQGAALVLDITQSAGAMPIDFELIRPDFAVAACYKWLCGPYSLGFLYVAPKWQDGTGLEQSWLGRAGSENFTRLVDYQDSYQPGARRFDMGERSSFHLMPMALKAMRQISDWGVENISHTLGLLTREIAARAALNGMLALDEDRRAPHYLGLRFMDGVPPGLVQDLAQRNIFVSARGDSVRVTPHLFNCMEDGVRLLEAIEHFSRIAKKASRHPVRSRGLG